MVIEHFFQCPKCWQEISVLIDTSVNHDEYIEDCEVCCNPMLIGFSYENGLLESFYSKSIEQ